MPTKPHNQPQCTHNMSPAHQHSNTNKPSPTNNNQSIKLDEIFNISEFIKNIQTNTEQPSAPTQSRDWNNYNPSNLSANAQPFTLTLPPANVQTTQPDGIEPAHHSWHPPQHTSNPPKEEDTRYKSHHTQEDYNEESEWCAPVGKQSGAQPHRPTNE